MTGADPQAVSDYYRLMNANGAAQVYHVARSVGVFEALAEGAQSAEALADSLDFQTRSMRLLLNALASLGLVSEVGETYCLTLAAQMVVNTDYRELGNQYWRHLPELLSTGEPLVYADDSQQSELFYQSQAATLGWMLAPLAAHAAERLSADHHLEAANIIDLGAGSAIWSLSIAARDPKAQVTAVDWPSVLEVAKETAEQFGIGDRLATIAGNLHEVDLPEATFDLAIVANVTHLLSVEENTKLFERIGRTIRQNGQLLIVDVMPGESEGDVPRSLYELGLALRTKNGCVYTPDELSSMLRAAGFERTEVIPLAMPPHTIGLMLAYTRT